MDAENRHLVSAAAGTGRQFRVAHLQEYLDLPLCMCCAGSPAPVARPVAIVELRVGRTMASRQPGALALGGTETNRDEYHSVCNCLRL